MSRALSWEIAQTKSTVCEVWTRFCSPASRTSAEARAEWQRRQQTPEQHRRPPLPLAPLGMPWSHPAACWPASPPSCRISSLGAACYPFASADPTWRVIVLTDLFPVGAQRCDIYIHGHWSNISIWSAIALTGAPFVVSAGFLPGSVTRVARMTPANLDLAPNSVVPASSGARALDLSSPKDSLMRCPRDTKRSSSWARAMCSS
jgi:hypothetical protein